MDINIKSIHFDATENLKDFINKKVNRLARRYENINNVEVTLNVIKPETSMNKEAGILISVPPREDIFASKIADTFEEAVDLSLEALEKQLERQKGKETNR
ncbi:MAG: ribosome-associated translation inhibitor RaiA [Muribaculum sp.]|nr:ribosome-associated translation inhibitor RaiA [Muribaculum sp.]MDE6459065.1 ribosome-associated translation inhibitor RaiA [Muribaculum sp.]